MNFILVALIAIALGIGWGSLIAKVTKDRHLGIAMGTILAVGTLLTYTVLSLLRV